MRRVLPGLLLLLVSVAARADWHEATSAHFVVYADDTPDNVRAIAERLERFDKGMRLLRNVPDRSVRAAARVTIFVVRDTDEVQQYAGRNVAGFIRPSAAGSTAFIPRRANAGNLSPMNVLQHEYAHHFMFSSWPSVVFPSWYIEGFAEFHATASFRADGSIVFGARPEYRDYGVGLGGKLPLRQLLQPRPADLTPLQMHVLYSRGWLLTHYLSLGKPERLPQLAAYLTALNEGKSPDQAISAFGDLSDLDLDGYLKERVLKARAFDARSLGTAAITVRALRPGEAAIMPARLRSTGGVTQKSAPEVAAQARRLAAPHLDDIAVQLELAEAEFDAGNHDASRAAAEQALALDPRSVRALLYAGMARMGKARKDKRDDAAEWRAIRQLFLDANRIDPYDPQPLVLLHESYQGGPLAVPRGVKDGLVAAYGLAPFDPELRIKAARVFLEDGRLPLARQALAPVANLADEDEEVNVAARTLEALDSSGSEAAIRALDAALQEQADKARAKEDEGG